MSQLGKAYIEVIADLKKFPADLRAKLKAAMGEAVAGVEFTELDNKAEKAGQTAAQHVRRGFSQTAKRELLQAGEEGGKSILGGLRRVFSRGSSNGNGFFSDVGSFFKDTFSQVSSAAQAGFKSLSDIGSNVGDAFSKIGDFGGKIGSVLKIGAFAVLIPVALQLAGALVQLGAAIFALPAAVGVALAVVAPLMIAFQGFGAAVSAGLSGDVKKFNEALKGLSPSAAAVVKEVVKLNPIFKSLQKTVQESFFAPLVGVVAPALRTFLNSVGPGLSRVAHSLGEFGASLLSVLSDGDVLGDLNDLFATTARIVKSMSGPLSSLFGSFFGLVQTGLPFVERFFKFLGGGINSLVDWLAKIQGSGTLTGWLERAGHILKTLLSLGRQFGDYLLTLFGGEIGDNGTKFLDEFKVKLQALLDYLKSPEGQKTIHNLGVLLKFVGDVFLFLISLEPSALQGFNLVFDAVRLLLKGLQALGAGFVWLIAKIVQFVVWIGTGIGHGLAVAYRAVVKWVSSAGTAIGHFFTQDIPRWFGQLVDWFSALPGRILDALHGLQSAGRQWIVDTLEGWYSAVFEQLGKVIGLFLALPYMVQTGWERTISFIGDFFSAAWAWAVKQFWDGVHVVEAVVTAIPGLLSSAGSAIGFFFLDLGQTIWNWLTVTLPNALGQAMSAVGDFFVGLWNNVIVAAANAIRNGFNSFVDFIYGLPGRIAALGPRLYDAAVGLGRQIASGLSSIGHFAEDIGNRVANALKTAINWVISKINVGITDIDNQLPVSLPRIPMLARGAIVDSPTLALVGEAGPEVVVPLGNRARAQQLAEQSGLLTMLRGPDGGAPKVFVTVYLDPTGAIIPITKTVVDNTLNEQGEALAFARAA